MLKNDYFRHWHLNTLKNIEMLEEEELGDEEDVADEEEGVYLYHVICTLTSNVFRLFRRRIK